jgi:CRP/FNR family transcriptional regulator, anaerobic regulatory protein
MERDMGAAALLEAEARARTVSLSRVHARTPPTPMPTLCSTCALRPTCLPCGMLPQDLPEVDGLIYTRRRVRAGEHLYRAGEPFRALYAFRTGFFKSYVDAPDGQTQVIGFPMAGEVVGMDGIATDHHRLSVIALDDGEACVIPYSHLQSVALRIPALQHQLHKLMSREILREQGLMTLLGSMRADARVAAFLLGLSEKFAARGYSATQFHLRMTREEIGSYLGLKLETVSRVLSRFQEQGLIKAQVRSITIVDVKGLKTVVPEF